MTVATRIIFSLLVLFNWVNLAETQVFLQPESDLFPIPEGLKPNVEFWIQIYALYGSHQVLLHDSDNLRIIYEVIDFKKIFGDTKVSERVKLRYVEKKRREYRRILKKLFKLSKIEPETLSASEKYVYNLFGDSPTKKRFYRAYRNIRAQQGLNDRFKKGLIRSGRYMDEIRKIFRKYNLPEELTILPHVESSFNYRAYSKLGAAGLWQFTRHTGRRFLKINYTVDERFDPIKSTEAAAKLLLENYQRLGNWPLAITAYNHGLNGMLKAQKKVGSSDIWKIIQNYRSRLFGFASRNFYAEFLAALHVVKNYKFYFGDIEFERPPRFIVVKLPHYLTISTIVKTLNVTVKEIKALNPALRKPVLNSKRRLPRRYELRIPWRENFDPNTFYAHIPEKEKFDQQVQTYWYQVRRGDNLRAISRRFQTSINSLMALNEIRDPNQIYVGQVLKIPTREKGRASSTYLAAAGKGGSTISGGTDAVTSHQTPIRGDKPATSASSDDLVVHLGPAEEEQEIIIAPPEPFSDWITVQADETLGHFADWLEIPTQQLRRLNRLRYGQDIHIGQRIKLTYVNVPPEEFNRRRMEYHKGIEEDFFNTYKVEGVQVHQIKRGENIWYLCNQVYEIPYWLVMKYNSSIDLENLKTGDKLIIPVVALNDSKNSES